MEPLRLTCMHEDCFKTYSNPFNLKRHIESFHQGIKKFFCGICGKGLSSKQNMREHSFIHQGTKPYTCTFPNCPEAFRQLSQLKMHRAFHSEVSKFIKRNSSEPLIDLSSFPILLSKIDLNECADAKNKDFELPAMNLLKKKFEFGNLPEF